MKTTIQATLFSICVASTSAIAENYDLDLEPCINGEVSASGLFPSQEAEDRFYEAQLDVDLDLEPCINGEVSASGLFPNQEAEDRHQLIQMEQQGKYGATATNPGTLAE